MAIDQGTETVELTSQERTWRINIETARNADPVVTVFRETIRTDDKDEVISTTMAETVDRRLSLIKDEVQSFKPSIDGQITAAELAGLIAARADMWAQEDKNV